MSGSGGRPFWMSGSGRDALMDVREWTKDSLGCPGVNGRASRMFGSVRKALPDVREWS